VKLVEQELWQREEKGLIGILPVRDAAETSTAVGPVLSQGDLLTYWLFGYPWVCFHYLCVCPLPVFDGIGDWLFIYFFYGIFRCGKWFRREELENSSGYIWFSKAWCQKSTGNYSLACKVCFITAASTVFCTGYCLANIVNVGCFHKIECELWNHDDLLSYFSGELLLVLYICQEEWKNQVGGSHT
jgi:hypothetical protein